MLNAIEAAIWRNGTGAYWEARLKVSNTVTDIPKVLSITLE
jgi:hypothetical protein